MKSIVNKALLVTGVSLVAAGSAIAQTPAAPADPTATTIGDIVVTAQRRSERLIDVPVSVSVATGEQLEAAGITNSTDLKLITPALNLTVQGSFVQPTIRGVGTSVVGPGADGNVALYIDGVYQAVQAAAMFELNDIASIEVLKGPQGTLFGRNATGGAMVVTTAPPSFTPQGRFTASYATFNDTKLTGYLSGPLSDTIAASLSVVSHKNDGYTDNIFTGTKLSRLDAFAARAKVLWQPRDDLSLTLIGSYVDHSDNSGLTYTPDKYNFQYPNSIAGRLNPRDRQAAMDYDPKSKLEGSSFGLNAVYTPEWGTITSVTSYSELKQPFFTDTDGTEMLFQIVESPQDQSTFYQEITFASRPDQRLSWLAGVNYYDDSASSYGRITQSNGVNPPGPPAILQPNVDTQAFAVYAEGNLNLTDRLHFILGGRYNHEEKVAFGRYGGPTGPALLNNSESWDSFTPRASLRYELTPQSSAYVAYSEGFKSGMFNASNLDNTPIEPETIKSYEIGYKYAASGFVFTGAAYYYDYTNIQVNAIRGGLGTVTVTNAGAAEISGADFDVTIPVNNKLTIKGGASYIDGEYTRFDNAVIYVPNANGLGFTQTLQNVPGATLVKTPKYTAFTTIMYEQSLPVGELRASMTASYNDGWYWDPSNTSRQDSYTQVNARVVWAPNDQLTVAVFADNLTDELIENFRRQSTRGDVVAYAKPRMIGIELGYGF